jgi:glycine/sarcosine N-methyltransferase
VTSSPFFFASTAPAYALYVPWETRLAREIPFLERSFRGRGVRRILDAACGPGRHAVALAKRGFAVTGLDASAEMLLAAREHARAENVPVELVDFVEGTVEDLPPRLRGSFDGLLCLGNSLAALASLASVPLAVASFARALEPGGIAVTQTIDLSVVAPGEVTPSPLRRVVSDETEFFFVKSFVRVEDRVLIHFVTIRKKGDRAESEVRVHPVNDVEPSFLERLFLASGFGSVEALGDYSGGKFDKGVSKDLILVATRDAT